MYGCEHRVSPSPPWGRRHSRREGPHRRRCDGPQRGDRASVLRVPSRDPSRPQESGVLPTVPGGNRRSVRLPAHRVPLWLTVARPARVRRALESPSNRRGEARAAPAEGGRTHGASARRFGLRGHGPRPRCRIRGPDCDRHRVCAGRPPGRREGDRGRGGPRDHCPPRTRGGSAAAG